MKQQSEAARALRALTAALENAGYEAALHYAALTAEWALGQMQIALDRAATAESERDAAEARYRAALDALESDNERLRLTLVNIAKDGCGCVRHVPDGEGHRIVWCPDQHPNDPDEWCWCCVARAALAAHEEHRPETGVCEHCAEPCPEDRRFCSAACEDCEHESTDSETGCDRICLEEARRG